MSVDDQALDQSDAAQGGVRMILSTLRESEEKVSLFTVGSLRDVAAAYNREPELLRAEVRAIYANVGTGPDGYQEEWNVGLDQQAYRRVLLSDLPIEWYPCFGRDNYFTYFSVDQTEILGNSAAPLRAFFDYALTRSQEEPIPYLAKVLPAPGGPRNMWCTPAFIDIAGRKILSDRQWIRSAGSTAARRCQARRLLQHATRATDRREQRDRGRITQQGVVGAQSLVARRISWERPAWNRMGNRTAS